MHERHFIDVLRDSGIDFVPVPGPAAMQGPRRDLAQTAALLAVLAGKRLSAIEDAAADLSRSGHRRLKRARGFASASAASVYPGMGCA